MPPIDPPSQDPSQPSHQPLPTTQVPGPGAAPPQQGWGSSPGWVPMPQQAPPPGPGNRRALAAMVAVGLLGLVGFGLLALSLTRGEGSGLALGSRIGVVEVKGTIGGGGSGVDADRTMKELRRFGKEDGIKAVVIRIDSPGGAVAPSQEIHDEILVLAKKKPVVCSLGNLAASGGFYIAVACPRIVAEPGTLTGSIGVISQFINVKGLVERFDVKVENIKSGKLKDMGDPFHDMPPEVREYWQSVTQQIYEQFLKAVVDGRKLPEEKVRAVADGRVITGQDAKALGLIDLLGNFWVAVEAAKAEAKLSGDPQLVYPPEERGHLLERLMGSGASAAARAVTAEVERSVSQAQAPGLYLLAR
jgi:protease-4